MRHHVLILLCITLVVFAASVAALTMSGPYTDAIVVAHEPDIVRVYEYVPVSISPQEAAQLQLPPGAQVTKLVLKKTISAYYSLKVEGKAIGDGQGWVGVQATGSLNSNPVTTLTPGSNIERIGWYFKITSFDRRETVRANAYGSFKTDTQTGSFTLTGTASAASSAGGTSTSVGARGVAVSGSSASSLSMPGTSITATESFNIRIRDDEPPVIQLPPGSGSGSGSGASSGFD